MGDPPSAEQIEAARDEMINAHVSEPRSERVAVVLHARSSE